MAGLRKYDVFLSFRGEDTRRGFTSHLHKALCQEKVDVYMDQQHERAEPIDTILDKIEDAALSIIVFSPNFANSDFCLDEVVKIVECHHRNGHKIFPIFYGVSTDAVQEPNGSFSDAISTLAAKGNDMLKRVPNWRNALSVASSHTGLVSTHFRNDAEFVAKIVEEVLQKLCEMSPMSESKNLVGIESRISEIRKCLDIGVDVTRIVCLWGLGGYGKTTSAKEAFKQFSISFQNRCFLEKVTESYSNPNTADSLKLELYSNLLSENFKSCMDLDNRTIKARLRRTKVLIVLDDVDDSLHLKELLLGSHETFASGSKIIVTSRKDAFQTVAHKTIEVKGLNQDESLQLLSMWAFEDEMPPSKCRHKDSLKVIEYCQNNPVALKVLGASMSNKRDDENWESLIKDLSNMKLEEFHEVLKISYDRLSKEEQRLFLDIACFFRGKDRAYVTKILDSCYNSVFLKTTNLIERALVTVSDSNKVEMHDLIRKMAQDIVEDESPSNSARGTRLWKPESIKEVFRNRKGIDAIESIFFELSQAEEICLEPDAFATMNKLRLLKFYVPSLSNKRKKLYWNFKKKFLWNFFSKFECSEKAVSFPNGLHSLPNELCYLFWYEFPLASLPSSFSAEKLVELNLQCSSIRKLWAAYPNLPKLRRIDLRHSKLLTEVPDLSKAKDVERINLEGCERLRQLHSSFQELTKLEYLNLSGCSKLVSLPSQFKTKKLKTLDLSRCPKVTTCPEVSGGLLVLNISYTAIVELPQSFHDMKGLVVLDFKRCVNINPRMRRS